VKLRTRRGIGLFLLEDIPQEIQDRYDEVRDGKHFSHAFLLDMTKNITQTHMFHQFSLEHFLIDTLKSVNILQKMLFLLISDIEPHDDTPKK
jgi:1,2-phenylacetyl-CoA epoxidase catalytic subunit